MADIYSGTAGWSYKDWVPNFYPKNQSKNFDFLRFYSQYFNAVEVNASYYTYVSPHIIHGWLDKISECENFLFTYKLHKDFTHARHFSDDNVEAVRQNLDILSEKGRLGGLLVQFPYSYVFNEQAAEYLFLLNEKFSGYEKFFEVRHSSWEVQRGIDFFRKNGLNLCTIDQPQIGRSVPFEPMISGDIAYVRFHGRNRNAWIKSIEAFGRKQTYQEQSSRYEYFYSPGELVEIHAKISEIFDKVKQIFVIMNNHPQAYAVANAFELLSLLKNDKKINIPPTTLHAFPRLKNLCPA